MNERLQKKCFMASAGLHLTLLVVFFFGSGFLASRNKPEDIQVLTILPMITTDANVNPNVGNPNTKPPAANPLPSPPPPRSEPPPPQPAPVRETESPKTPVRPDKPDPRSLETKDGKKPSTPVNFKEVVRKPSRPIKPTTTPTTDDNSQARAEAEHHRLFGSVVRGLRQNLSGATTVQMPPGEGGGATYANYKQVVGSIYFQAWIVPDDVDADAATAVASVTILKNGDVLSASITKSSGNKAVDRSVQVTLDRVRSIAPFPEGSKDARRTFTINFNLKAKKAIG